MLKLYYSPGACAMASHIALEEAGMDYDLVKIDLKKGEQRAPEYLAINPAGVTPALQTNEGVLTENAVIMTWVVKDAQPALIPPPGSFDQARMNAFNAFLGSSLHPAIGRTLFARPPLEGEAREAALQHAMARYQLVEDHWLGGGDWLFGDYTVSDGYLSVFSRWARQANLLDRDRFPRLNAHLDRVQSRPAVQRVLEQEGLQGV